MTRSYSSEPHGCVAVLGACCIVSGLALLVLAYLRP